MKKGFKIIVLAKQVPDTHNVGKDAMKEDGTMNRAALPAIINPEDLNALEQALRIKDQYPETQITVLTMGLPKAVEVLKEGLYRGVDKGILLTDRKLGGSDTLATSYAIAQAIKTVGDYDMVLCGRQAIDGDTAQVGPQAAEKLGIPQITYAEEIQEITESSITVKRRLESGVEVVKAPFPVLVTVHGSAAACRTRNAKFYMKNKNDESNIITWGAADINVEDEKVGKAGSPTTVKKIDAVVLQAKESKKLTSSDQDVDTLIKDLLSNHILG
ncbi:MAG: electron transfer flavoprotein subunit beta/FixA family protein [Bacteroidales bacterium]|jgi:electron transfer flavoprotein beta subunit|nr:electron transfer flavoprotein subunit beta/FixA family protein [Bacteroidales bacterium]